MEWISVKDKLPEIIDNSEDSESVITVQLFEDGRMKEMTRAVSWYNYTEKKWYMEHYKTVDLLNSGEIKPTHWKHIK